MKLSYKFRICDHTNLRHLCETSRKLYNQALYIIRYNQKQQNGLIVPFDTLYKTLKTLSNANGEIYFETLGEMLSYQTLKILYRNIRSYLAVLNNYKQYPKKYTGEPKFPNYLRRKEFLLIFPHIYVKIHNNILYLPLPDEIVKIRIPEYKGKDFSKLCEVRVIPKYKHLEIEIIYHQKIENTELNYNRCAAIDLGLYNLVTLVTNLQLQPLIISGGIPKSINQWYNKEIARLKSIAAKMKLENYTEQMIRITDKRNCQIKDYFHKISRFIVRYLLHYRIGVLVVGQSRNWKTQLRVGKRYNQVFRYLPLQKFVKMLQYKCQLVGIKFIVVNEAYTSKCDALALEEVKKHNKYLGERVTRGLFQSSIGKLINADVNGALNILRRAKVVCDSDIKRIADRGFIFNPVKIRSLYETNSLRKVLA